MIMEYVCRFSGNRTKAILIPFLAVQDGIQRHISREESVEYFMKPEMGVSGVQYAVGHRCDVRIYECDDVMANLHIVSVHGSHESTVLVVAQNVISESNGNRVNIGKDLLERYFNIEERGLAPRTKTASERVV